MAAREGKQCGGKTVIQSCAACDERQGHPSIEVQWIGKIEFSRDLKEIRG
jgi:hypothetical protein